jgi:hypothetical protein
MEKRRIPNTLLAFNSYLLTVNDHLQMTQPGASVTNGGRLGLTSAELITLDNFHTAWISDDPANPGAYFLHSNKVSKTEVTRKNVLEIMKDFTVFFRPILWRISGCLNITNADRAVLRIAPPVTSHVQPVSGIEEDCFAMLHILGGGNIKISCKTSHESGRAAKPDRADAVEIAYRTDRVLYDSQTGEIIPIHVIESPDDGTLKKLSTKAVFQLNLGIESAGSKLQLFARWINTKHPHLAGAWTGPFSTFIG